MRPLFLLFAFACGESTDSSGKPAPEGATPQAPILLVGTEEVVVESRHGFELTAQVWYPSYDTTIYSPLLYDGIIQGEAYENLAPSCDSVHPVAVFSHGFSGVRYQSPFLLEFLASEGYIVVAPDHLGNTFFDTDIDLVAELVLRRPDDIIDSFDWLLTSKYAACIDPDAGYAVIGHSFGGYTALAVAGATINDPVSLTEVNVGDDRVWAAVPLAPWDVFGALTDGTKNITVPTMILSGELDTVTPLDQVSGLWEHLGTEKAYFGSFPDGGHYSFSPLACLAGFSEESDGCGEGFIDFDEFADLVNTSTLEFLKSAAGDEQAISNLPTSEELIWH